MTISEDKRRQILRKIVFWLRNRITGKADCNGWCPKCEFYESCKNDIDYDEY